VKAPLLEENGMRTDRLQDESGFSLIELMIAMLITLIISGAIYGLMSTGQGAFRREPELADRQQNIRAAMDLLQRDVEVGGSGMDAFRQVFTDGLNAPAGAPARPDGTITDYLEVRGNDGLCPSLSTCPAPGGGSVVLFSNSVVPTCYQLPALVYIANTDPNDPGVHFAFQRGGGGGGPCGAGPGYVVNFPPGQGPPAPLPGNNPPGGFCGAGQPNPCNAIMKIQVVRYQIWIDPADPLRIPNLGGVRSAWPCPTEAAARAVRRQRRGSWSRAGSRTCRCST